MMNNKHIATSFTEFPDCGESLRISNESSISQYQSSEWVERGFCLKCGLYLFYLLKPANQYHLPAGLLDELKSNGSKSYGRAITGGK